MFMTFMMALKLTKCCYEQSSVASKAHHSESFLVPDKYENRKKYNAFHFSFSLFYCKNGQS